MKTNLMMLLSQTISKRMMIPLSVILGLAQLMLDDRSRNEIELLKKIK